MRELEEMKEELWCHHCFYYLGILQYDVDHVLRIKEEFTADLDKIIAEARKERQ